MKTIQQQGGLAVLKKYGKNHYKKMAQKSAITRKKAWKLYEKSLKGK